MEAKLRSKRLYKVSLIILKVLPVILAFGYTLNSLLSYFNIDIPILSSIFGMSLIPIIYLYIVSYVFGFCNYHRVSLHYIVVLDIVNIYDYYIGIPLSTRELFALNIGIFGFFIVMYVYLKFNCNGNKNSRPKEML